MESEDERYARVTHHIYNLETFTWHTVSCVCPPCLDADMALMFGSAALIDSSTLGG